MKKLLLLALFVLSLSVCLVSCGGDEESGETPTTPDGGDEEIVVGTDIHSKTLALNGENLTATLPNSQTEFSFLDDIQVSEGASYVVARDTYCENVIYSKLAPLVEGDNVFYILVTNGKDMQKYTVTIRRLPMYTVSFNTSGGTAVESQKVEEGSLVKEPTAPTKIGHTFVGWDYDFAKPVTQNIDIKASWAPNPGFENFEFEYNNGECMITGLIDATVTEVVIPDGVTSIGYEAFRSCDSLTSVVIGNSVTSIGEYAFGNCYSLTSVVIGNSVTSIGERAFYWCDGLASVVIGKSVKSIGDAAFDECYRLVEVYNLSSLNIQEGSEDYGYVGLYALNVYTPTSGESKLHTTSDGFIFYEDGETRYLVGYKGNETDITLPEDCNGKNYKINKYAFFGCTNLTSIVIPDSVMSIGSNAFYNCYSLTSVVIPDSVTSIGSGAFVYCSSLTSIKYRGTEAQWNAISKGTNWNSVTGNYTITYNYEGE